MFVDLVSQLTAMIAYHNISYKLYIKLQAFNALILLSLQLFTP